jgi:hypothetical protein
MCTNSRCASPHLPNPGKFLTTRDATVSCVNRDQRLLLILRGLITLFVSILALAAFLGAVAWAVWPTQPCSSSSCAFSPASSSASSSSCMDAAHLTRLRVDPVRRLDRRSVCFARRTRVCFRVVRARILCRSLCALLEARGTRYDVDADS